MLLVEQKWPFMLLPPLLLVLISCGASEQGPSVAAEQDTVTSADIDAERAAIQKTVAEHAAASNRDGARGYASYATADARWLPPGSPAISGREAIERWNGELPGRERSQIAWEHPHVVVSRSGDIAYSVGTFEVSGQDAEGRPQTTEGKLVNIWHKQADGSWKIAVGIWNGNEPPTAPAR